MSRKLVIVGAGGHAREVLDVVEACNTAGDDYDVLGFLVEPQYGAPGTIVNDKPILGGFDWLKGRDGVSVVCAVGSPALRLRLARTLERLNVRFATLVHPSATLTRWVKLGEGAVICAGCILTNRITIGNHVQVNVGCTISHDAIIEDFATLAPGVHVAGHVTMREGCEIGTGATIIPRREVGAWSIVGAGSTVVEEVPSNTTVVGTPGRVIKTRPDGWQLESFEF